MISLVGRTALVTGASKGIGKELTAQFVALGVHVVAVARDADALNALATSHGNSVTTHVADLADPVAVDTLVRTIAEQHPGLSILVNNAGIQVVANLVEGAPENLLPALRREISVNFDAVVALSAGLLPQLRHQPTAAIVNITTGLALAPKSAAPVYCASKAAVRTFTRALRYQCQGLAPRIQVTDAVMTLVDTDMTTGRGSGKISPAAAASAVIDGLRRGSTEIFVGRTKLLRAVMRISPTLGFRLLRDA